MDEEAKLYVDMLKGVSLAAIVTVMFRESTPGEKIVYLSIAASAFALALWLVTKDK